MLYGVVFLHNMWYNGIAVQPEVLCMKLNYDRKSKDPTYFIQQGIRNGKKVTTKNIVRIGKHSELKKITDDPLAYAKEQVRKYNEEYKAGKIEFQFKIDFEEKLIASGEITSRSQLKNIGYFILQKIYQDLRLNDFFSGILKEKKITFPCNDINRFLTYGRILDPDSKWGTYDRIDTYYGLENNFDYHHILRHLDVLSENFDKYMEHLFENSNNIVKRNRAVCYFDCTNYFFECEHEDDVYIDPVTGEIMRGLRKYGPSKEHRTTPIVQMGLFMDGNGIPISMCISPGSQNEQISALPLEHKIINMFGTDKLIYCADAGLGSYNIREYNSMGEKAYIVTQSIKMLSGPLKEAIFSDCDYRRKSNGEPASTEAMKKFDRFDPKNTELYKDKVYKVLVADTAVDTGLTETVELKNGKTKKQKVKGLLKQYIIVSFSRKTMEYQRHVRNGQVERARELLRTKDPEMIKKGPNDVTRFIKRRSAGKDGEKAIDSYYVDESVIAEEEKYDGYYAIVTSELKMSDTEMRRIYRGLSRIEDSFKITKTYFNSRPVFVRTNKHIEAHFCTCFIALVLMRLLEKKLEEQFPTGQILTSLKKYNCVHVDQNKWLFTYYDTILDSCAKVFKIELNKRYHTQQEIQRLLKY